MLKISNVRFFSNGGFSNKDANVIISNTFGEPIAKFLTNETILLKQGFEQPLQDTVISTFTINKQLINIKLYPNPAINNLNILIDYNSSINISYRIVGIDGKNHYTGLINQPLQQIDLNPLAPGIYLIILQSQDNKQIRSLKFEKIK